jgi:hypothetical protein
VNSTTQSIECSELSAEEIASRINLEFLDEGQVIDIKDDIYIYRFGKGLVPQDEDESERAQTTARPKNDSFDEALSLQFLRTSQAIRGAQERLAKRKEEEVPGRIRLSSKGREITEKGAREGRVAVSQEERDVAEKVEVKTRNHLNIYKC